MIITKVTHKIIGNPQKYSDDNHRYHCSAILVKVNEFCIHWQENILKSLLCSTFNSDDDKIENKQKHFLLFSYKVANQIFSIVCMARPMLHHAVMNDVYRPYGP